MAAGIHQEVSFKATPQRIYTALTDSKQFSSATGGAPAEISGEDGGAFSCFGGMIEGRNIELVPNRRIVQAWRAKPWPEGVYSIVKFELRGDGKGTKLVLDHTGYPEGEEAHLAPGWDANYWQPLKKYLG